jgi:hypothetical protein
MMAFVSGSPFVYIDHYGNAMSGIRAAAAEPSRQLRIGARTIDHARVFADAAIGAPFWYERTASASSKSPQTGRMRRRCSGSRSAPRCALSETRSQCAAGPILTIGHGNRPLEEFVVLLKAAAVDCLVDVRAFPGSRRHPHFGRGALERSLPAASVEYAWEGEALGGRRRPRADSPHVALRNASFRAYADHMQSDAFRRAIERLVERSERQTLAIMCAERLPWQCHRYMISDYLVAQGVAVRHLIDENAPRAHALRREARVTPDGLVYDAGTQTELDVD